MAAECVICGGRDFQELWKGLKRCASCDLVLADVDISEEELKKIYQNDYFFGAAYVDYKQERKALQYNFCKRLKELLACFEHPNSRSLFEIGSAYGFFLELARGEFQRVKGIDVSAEACRHAQGTLGLDVIQGDFLRSPIEKNAYDAFCMWDTIEHLQKPHLYIEKISQLIRPNGLVCLTTGDIDSFVAKFRQEKWRLIQPPFHLFYFSTRTIARLLHNYGFEVIFSSHPGNYRTLNTLFLRHQGMWLQRLIEASPFGDIPLYLNLFDIVYVIGRKK